MTFLQLINDLKQKYPTNNEVVIFTIVYKLSRKVKTKLDFMTYRNEPIDFNKTLIYKHLDDYFYQNKPLGQIVHHTTFYGSKIDIFKSIFEPRSETEWLTEKVVTMLKKRKDLVGGVDLCCGTGCIGITIKKHCPWVDMTLVDINKKAISNTTHNAKLNKVNVKTITGGFYQSLIKRKLKFDFIVCNPPYVDIKALDKSMTKYETKISFVNSPHSLDFYKTIIKNMSKLVNKHGFVAFEIGYDQKPQLEKLLANKEHSFYKDLNGNDRLLIIYC